MTDPIARLTRGLVVLAITAVALVVWPAGATASPLSGSVLSASVNNPGVLALQVVPPLAGVVVNVDGTTAKSNATGRLWVPVRNFIDLESRVKVPETQIAADRKVVFDRFRGELSSAARGKVIEMGVRTSRLVSWQFVDRFGNDFPVERVESMRIRSSTGEVVEVTGPATSRPLWVAESRTQQTPTGLLSKRLYYVIDSAVVAGTSVVHRAQQRFVPWVQRQWRVQLLFFQVTFASSDLLFTYHVGAGLELIHPDGTVERLPFGASGIVSVANLPRGAYQVRSYGGGLSFVRPVNISKDQQVELTVISWLDLTLVFGLLLSVAVGLVLLGRPYLLGRLRERVAWLLDRGELWWPRLPVQPLAKLGMLSVATRRRHAVAFAVVILAALAGLAPSRPAAGMAAPAAGHAGASYAAAGSADDPVPVFAHYYIWFNPTSWNRAKIDYPLLGRYSSDDAEIMRRHVRMAKAAGIDGFLVSWKHTTQLDERLATLAEVARSEEFHLGIVYQGLDFERQPLPLATVKADLDLFADRYGADPVFDVFDKPLVVWTGSNIQTRANLEATIAGVRGRLLVLGNAKTVQEVEAMGPVVDGQAYYWSSVDPVATSTAAKLAEMSAATHRNGGVWVAPVAPGFDARLVGGTKEVLRRDGNTLRASFAAARASNPDAIGVISWNEFSENTHIEPSQRYGSTDLATLADLLGARVQLDVPGDSSDAGPQHHGLTGWGALLLAGAGILLVPAVLAVRRRQTVMGGPSAEAHLRPPPRPGRLA